MDNSKATQAGQGAQLDLSQYDVILVNNSGGKDSQAMLHHVAQLAKEQGLTERVHVVHATFREEWQGTEEIARQQAAAYGLPFHVVQHRGYQGSLLNRVRARGQWPGRTSRYCTAEFKRNQVGRIITELVKQHPEYKRRPIRVLNAIGIRAAESRDRRKRGNAKPQVDGAPLFQEKANGVKVVTQWWPIFRQSVQQVWATIQEAGTPVHFAYAAGMPRLSCVFCVFAPKEALHLAGTLNRELLEEYVQVEREIGHAFTPTLKIASVLEAVERGDALAPIKTWEC